MLLNDLYSILSLIVCAHITESKVYLLRDYDDELIYIDTEDRRLHLEPQSSNREPLVSSEYKRKRSRTPKQAVVHYGRHIYHLDSFEDLTKLRSKLKPDYISYDYFDFNDLYRSSDPVRTIPWDYLGDIVFLGPRPKYKKCKGKKCEGNLRKYNPFKSKYLNSKDNIVKNKKLNTRQNPFKRFKIIGNSNKSKSKAARKPAKKNVYSSEEKSYNKKRKPTYDHKKKYTSKSSEESKEWSKSNSNESEEKYKKNKKKKKYVPNFDNSDESTEYALQKIKKKLPYDSGSDSFESKLKYFDSNSIEESWQKKKKKKKNNYGSSEEKKRKTFDNDGEMVLQGNNMYDTKGFSDDTDDDRRRRLPQFLPKRYHWDPANINELGYYWFNGPKGKFPSPTLVGRRKN